MQKVEPKHYLISLFVLTFSTLFLLIVLFPSKNEETPKQVKTKETNKKVSIRINISETLSFIFKNSSCKKDLISFCLPNFNSIFLWSTVKGQLNFKNKFPKAVSKTTNKPRFCINEFNSFRKKKIGMLKITKITPR